jgi:hypothetical protein
MYDQLKQQVQHMKLDQQELHASKAKQKEVSPLYYICTTELGAPTLLTL